MSFIQLPVQYYPSTALGVEANIGPSGPANTAFGYRALYAPNGGGNTAIGSEAGLNSNGGGNTFIGALSGRSMISGINNTILGSFTGLSGALDIRYSNNYVVIADGSGNPRIIVDPAGLVSAPGGFAGAGGGGAITINNQVAAYTVTSSDLGKIVNCIANTFTVSLTAAATLGAGFNCWVWNTGTGVITIDPNGAETIDGVSTLTLRQGEGTQIVCNGTNWETGSKKTMRAYAENMPSSAVRPVAQNDSCIAIGRQASAFGLFGSIAFGYLASSSGSSSTAVGRSSNASQDGASAIGFAAAASSPYGTAIGTNSGTLGSQAVTNTAAMALGGSYASGTDSFAAAVANNTSSYGAKGANSIAIGQSNNSTASGSSTLGGILNTASGSQSVAVGGNTNTASGTSSFATGYLGDTQNVELKAAFGNGFAGVSGSSQFGIVNVKRSTTNATPTVLNVWDSATPNANNMVLLQNNSAFAFSGTVVARQQASGGTQSAAWRVEGLIRREAGAATTTLVASTVTVISNVPGWNLALSADTAIGALAITATGAVGTNIRWVGNIQTSECIYA